MSLVVDYNPNTPYKVLTKYVIISLQPFPLLCTFTFLSLRFSKCVIYKNYSMICPQI